MHKGVDRVDRVEGLMGKFPIRSPIERNTQNGLHPVHPVQIGRAKGHRSATLPTITAFVASPAPIPATAPTVRPLSIPSYTTAIRSQL